MKLTSLPLQQLTGFAGSDYDKLVALIDAYTEARCREYVSHAGTMEQIRNQQEMIALGRALNEALIGVTIKP